MAYIGQQEGSKMVLDSECQALSMGQLFNSILSNSIDAFVPMCNSSSPRVYSPTYPMNNQNPTSAASTDKADLRPSTPNASPAKKWPTSLSIGTCPDPPRRPPLNPTNLRKSCQNRKVSGLSISVPSLSPDPHILLPPDHDNPPPRISCSSNVELRRKSLSERHFFRPVSEDEESSMGTKQN